VAFDKIDEAHLKELKKANFEALAKTVISHSDGLIMASDKLPKTVVEQVKNSNKPQLDFSESQDEEAYIDFYTNKI